MTDAPLIWVRFSDDGRHIRKWDFKPFEGGVRYRPVADMGEEDIAHAVRAAMIAVGKIDRGVRVHDLTMGEWRGIVGAVLSAAAKAEC